MSSLTIAAGGCCNNLQFKAHILSIDRADNDANDVEPANVEPANDDDDVEPTEEEQAPAEPSVSGFDKMLHFAAG